jgi:glycosyltransferase involved in cell wall biosynthesis
MKKVSVVIPAYNEEDCIPELTQRLKAVMGREQNYSWEVLIVENGSVDKTWSLLVEIAKSDTRFKILKLSRNFRMDGGLTAGLDFITGDACVLMTADLQDPPELIHEFLRKWEEGYENVYGVVQERQGINPIRRFNSKLFYSFAKILTNGQIPKNVSDFRLVDKKVYVAVRDIKERNRFMRGLFAWVGFNSIGVPMNRPPRFAGVSNAHTGKVLELAMKGIFAHSYKPLRFISLIGLSLSILSFLALIPMVFIWLFIGVPFAGFGSLVALILLGIGMQALMLGIVSEYLGLVYEEVKMRPNYLVSESVGYEVES